jgi:hypothetical protein
MSGRILAVAAFCAFWSAGASADRLYADGFEIPVAPSQFPLVDGHYAIPSGPAADQLAWILGELRSGETTTAAEVSAHFDPGYDVPSMQAFFESLRGLFPNAVVTDVIGVTPVDLTVLINAPDAGPPFGFLRLQTRYTGNRLITLFGVNNFGGSVMYPEDQALDLGGAVAKFHTLSADPALLVGRIDRRTGRCSPIAGDAADQLRATGSIFKTWVLGGLAGEIAHGHIRTTDGVVLEAGYLAQGGTINGEPLGTVFPVTDMAALMMGISDNTATDHLHHFTGRSAIDAFVGVSGVADPNVLEPLLDISEQFHLFQSFPLDVSLAYVNGTEEYQRQFLDEQIVPLGPAMGGPYTAQNVSLLTHGSWRASPLDICAAFSRLRRLPQGSDAIWLVDHALGAQAAQPNVRNVWGRVWYKGGSLSSGSDGYHVLTHAWMLENTGEDPYVVIAMSNDDDGGIDEFKVQSITGRLLQLVSQMP